MKSIILPELPNLRMEETLFVHPLVGKTVMVDCCVIPQMYGKTGKVIRTSIQHGRLTFSVFIGGEPIMWFYKEELKVLNER